MKRDRQSVEMRRQMILDTIRQRQEIRVEELAQLFGISLMTVRRDLQQLEDAGLIKRFYGGATIGGESTTLGQESTLMRYRKVIARHVAKDLADGNTVFINGSNTALLVLDYVRGKRLDVYTNNGMAVDNYFDEGVSVTFLGGTIRNGGHIMTGDCTMRNLLTVEADIALLGCTGISSGGEILCDIPTELGINETMSAHARMCTILCDHTKIGKTGTYASCSLEKNCTVVTDEMADRDVVERLRGIGLTVILLDEQGEIVA